MFRQILVDPRNCNYQRILWNTAENQIIAYKLLTLTYGTACAPFIANRVLKQLAHDEGLQFPAAKEILENDVYVDDVLFGADMLSEAKQLRGQISEIMKRGGFHLRKWVSNSDELLEECPSGNHERALEFPISENAQLKVLGLFWEPLSDSFQFRVTTNAFKKLTKWFVLSVIAKLYDPLGWLTPIIVVAKLMLQELWLRKLDWDESIPEDLQIKWSCFHNSLKELESLKIPRWTGQVKQQSICELHGFADASTKAYSAAVYIRVIDEELSTARVTLMMAKSKVAPLTSISIPRLELCGAVLLAKTLKSVTEIMALQDAPLYCHTDSTVVLAWLGEHPATWKSFVAHRVAQITALVPRAKWRYVPTKDNPADCASRGLLAQEFLIHQLWWHGPPWLIKHSARWPNLRPLVTAKTNLELRPTSSHQVTTKNTFSLGLLTQYSSWPKLLRVTAYCKRFIDAFHVKYSKDSRAKLKFTQPGLNAIEIARASKVLIKLVQAEFFAVELKSLTQGSSVPLKSPLNRLNPFLDSEGIVRIGGRLHNAPISYDEKHPILIPRHQVGELLASHAHLRSLHGGLQLTMHTLRQRYWLLGARFVVKSIIKKCVICVRQRADIPQQLMSNLPDFRITPSRCFSHTGVDYAGTFDVRASAGRGQKSHKTYVALFVCCVTRAIHLELVADYSSAAFIAAFHRFSARRGRPAHLYSDNGTTRSKS